MPRAIEALAKAFDNQPQHGGIALELGQLAIDLDEQDIAQRAFRAVTLMKADSGSGVTAQDRAIAYFHLGNMAYKQGDARRATSLLYHVASAVAFVWEGSRIHEMRGDARRLLLSRMVVDHRLSAGDPFRLTESAGQRAITRHLLGERAIGITEVGELLTAA